MLMQDARCNLFKSFLLSLDAVSQSMISRPLGIIVFNLCIEVNPLLSLIDLDLVMFLGTLMYSRICIVNRGY